jgi:hypothetical protein
VIPVRGTEGATTSFFSPDGRAIGFATSAGELRTASLTDGLVTTAARGASILYGAAWTGDDHIVYVHDGALWEVSRSGGEPREVTFLSGDEDDARVSDADGWRRDAALRRAVERRAVAHRLGEARHRRTPGRAEQRIDAAHRARQPAVLLP